MTVASAERNAQAETLALFISDLHLQPSMPRTTQAFFDFLSGPALKTARLYVLGDLFEYWAGDDDLNTTFNHLVTNAIRAVGDAGVELFWMAGNRDFLAGDEFAAATGMTVLTDPFDTMLGGHRLVLMHGDAQCTDDTDYMAFRAQVRHQEWQDRFLAMSLTERKAIIAGLRRDSRNAQSAKSYDIMDVNEDAIAAAFDRAASEVMIHGHTHRPAHHEYAHASGKRIRYVLPDWDCDVTPARGGWLAMDASGSIRKVGLDGIAAPD
ncbi:UDP-2,3-diacylglucosamine diphosphatase [soil metagenome]